MRIFGRHSDHKQGKPISRRAPDAYELYERQHRVPTPVKDPMEEEHQSEKVRRKPQRCNKIDYKAQEFIAHKKLELSKDDNESHYDNRSTTNMMISHPHRHQIPDEITHSYAGYDHNLEKHTHVYAGYQPTFERIPYSHYDTSYYYDHNLEKYEGGEYRGFSNLYQQPSYYDTGLNRRNDYYAENVGIRHGFRASTRAVAHKIMRWI